MRWALRIRAGSMLKYASPKFSQHCSGGQRGALERSSQEPQTCNEGSSSRKVVSRCRRIGEQRLRHVSPRMCGRGTSGRALSCTVHIQQRRRRQSGLSTSSILLLSFPCPVRSFAHPRPTYHRNARIPVLLAPLACSVRGGQWSRVEDLFPQRPQKLTKGSRLTTS